MIAALLTVAVRYWKPAALALVVMAAFAYRAVLVHERNAARREAAALSTRNAELRASVNQLTGALERQNAAVAAMRRSAEQAAAELARRSRAAGERASSARARAESEANRLAHAPIDSGCAAAVEWGARKAKELSRW